MLQLLSIAVIYLNLLSGLGTVESIEQWLGQTEAFSTVPQASRLGESLLDLASRREVRLGDLLTEGPAEEVADWLLGHTLGPSLRLAIAERLFYERRYDACLTWTKELEGEEVFSAELLHYLRAVAFRLVVDYDAAREELGHLPAEADSLEAELGPARQFVVEHLRHDLGGAEPKELSVIAERMTDAERRLALGAAGEPTQAQQQRALDALDELIRKLEEQQKQQQASSMSGAGSSSPAQESRPGDFKGPGEVNRKRLTAGDPWGLLSPAERERLTQEIARDFPGRYRGLIEGYFETLADPDSLSTEEPNNSDARGRP